MLLFCEFLQLFLVYGYLALHTGAISPEDDEALIKDTMDLIQFGEDNIELVDDLRDVFLVVGNSGVGKSTLAKFVTGNNSNLISVWSPGRGGYVIEDLEGDISINSTLVSWTLLPKLMLLPDPDGNGNLAFYDLPGFSDTRNVSVEIANAFFMKKVADHARRVKVIFVADYADLRASGNRKNLKDMLVQGTDYVRHMDKFRPAVSLIATKVDNVYINDTTIIEGIATFLESINEELEAVIDNEEKVEECRILLRELTTKSQGGSGFTRIGLFRAPDAPGPLTEVPTVMRGKPLINEILFDNTKYVAKVKDDFGVSLSPLAIANVTFMATNVFQNVTNLSVYFGALSTFYYNQLTSSQSGMTSLPPLYALLDLLHRDYNILAPLSAALVTAKTPQEFMDILRTGLTGPGPALDLSLLTSMENVNGTVYDILRLGGFLNFFQEIIGPLEGVTVSSWSDPFVTSLQNLGPNPLVALASERINPIILTALQAYGSALLDNFQIQYDGGFYREAVKLLLESDVHKISGFLDKLGAPAGLRVFSIQDWTSLASLSVSTPEIFKLLPDWPEPGLLVDLDDLLDTPTYDLDQWIQVGFETPLAYIQAEHDHLPERGRTEIHSGQVTSWGLWGPWADCPVGTFVSGMALKSDDQTREDASALNAVTFFCSKNYDAATVGEVTSSGGSAGVWGQEFHCPGALKAIGFQLRVEAPRGTGESCHLGVCVPVELDDTAGNNIRLICEDGNVLEGDGGARGEWTEERLCIHDQFLCGIQTQVADSGGKNDDEDATGLNNLNARCCNLPLH